MQLFPTLAHITLNILPAQASSVTCKQLFSGTKQILTDCCASLGPIVFKEIIIMKSAWGPDLYEMAAWNEWQVKDVNLFDFKELLLDDPDSFAWDKDMEADVVDGQ